MVAENAFENGRAEAAARAAGTTQLKTDVARDLSAAVERSVVESISAETNRWTQWRHGLNPGEVALYDQGLLVFGTESLGQGLRTVRGVDGKTASIEVEGLKHGRGGTLFVPSTSETQRAHGEVIARPKTNTV